MYLPGQAERGPGAALLLITIIVTGIFLLAYFNVQSVNEFNRRELEERASTVATALDSDKISKLTGGPSDLKKPEYSELKSKLTVLKQINSDARSMYLTITHDSEVFFLVDSQLPRDAYYRQPGQKYEQAPPNLINIFYSSPFPTVEGPVSDKTGTWISGLAPVIDHRTGHVVAVVGIDVDAINFNQSLLSALALPLGGGLILAIIVGAYEVTRRHDGQLLSLRSELVSIASHELRTPLVGIRWAVENFIKSNPGIKDGETIKAIYDSIIHLQAGTDDILQFTALTQRGRLTKKPTDLKALIQEICDAQLLVGQQKGVKIVMDSSWPDKLMVNCDPDRLRRAFHNVISNAIKYTRSNTDVIVRYERSPKEHHISIIDHGIGIPIHEQRRVFAGFYRASNAKATGVGGTGLGLYLTRVIMNQHKGHITFWSREGKGTAFVLTLPVTKDKLSKFV